MKKISSKTLVKHKIFELQLHKIKLPNGMIIDDYVYFKVHNGAMIIPIAEDGKVIFLKHYKYAANRNLYVLPGGIGEKEDESPLEIAKRELQEETGYQSNNFKYLGAIYTDPTNVANKTFVYIAKKCRKVSGTKLDATENLQLVKVSIPTFFSMLHQNKIKDGPTLASIALVYDELKNIGKESRKKGRRRKNE